MDLITLNQRFKWDGFLSFRLFAKCEHAQQRSDTPPRGYKLGTRYLSGLLANTTEGSFILAQLLIQRIIELIGEQTDTAVDILLPVLFALLQLE